MKGTTEAQAQTLKEMRGWRLVSRLHTGALVVVFAQKYHEARIIDLEGRIWSFSHYLAVIDHGSAPLSDLRR